MLCFELSQYFFYNNIIIIIDIAVPDCKCIDGKISKFLRKNWLLQVWSTWYTKVGR